MAISRHLARTVSVVAAAALVVTSMSAPAPARGEPGPVAGGADTVTALIVRVAEADQRLQQLGAQIQDRQEGVNRAIAEVQTARYAAETARRDVETSQLAVREANTAIAAAQQRFDTYAVAAYVNGPSESYLTAASPEDVIGAAGTGQTLQISFEKTRADLARARTAAVNEESSARAARERADEAAAQARTSMDAAVTTLSQTQRQFGDQQAEVDRVAEQRRAAQARLDAARTRSTSSGTVMPSGTATSIGAPTVPTAAADSDRAAPHDPAAATPSGAGQWDTTLPMVPSANVAGDPVAIINMVLQISSTSAQLTADLGRKFLTTIGILPEASAAVDPGITNGRIPRVYGRQASEYVIRRAMSQLGVPYSWGGGNANGPSRGIDQGAGTVGFDCSGLYLYAFAGVGIKLDHYSGSQYDAGRKIPSSQMRRGDLIFYGPNASQHEAMYLGDGQMLEAPYTGSTVKISPVRTSGMTPYVTRLIEY
ncbi:peptidoglycan endopeptidase RipA [Mycobacterium antarcticum]|uniref:NlpC/P60 family peptidoglycan endopeptidase RipA n=1 Tax=Mycolicibacterium sp. TUM20985 TaxID=3023370 RepID=UPI002573C4A2|nr:NlpC/P60 family peptidoglycan endopeptidase RipA [Mycolicibacterium sp. TUM20985]BDX31593.1 peptidoglycan endopeptidase RipA [Mycolicibacterium sp. TUM20985]